MSFSGPLSLLFDAVPPTSLSGPLSMLLELVPPASLSGPLPLVSDLVPGTSFGGPLAFVLDLIPPASFSGALAVGMDYVADGIDGRQIMTRSLPNTRITAGAVTANELGPAAVGRDQIIDGAVTPIKLDRGYVEAPFQLNAGSDFLREITGETPPASAVVDDEDVAVFADAATVGGRTSFTIPDAWDGVSDITVHFIWSNPAAAAGVHVMRGLYRVNGGALSAAQITTPDAPGATPQRSPALLSIPGSAAQPGDNIALRLFRDGGDAGDTEAQDLRVYRIVALVPVQN